MTSRDTQSMSELLARHRAVIPNWVALYYDEPIEIVSGKGNRVVDAEGKSYLDFFAGILTNMIGYDVPEVREAVERQLATGVVHTSHALPAARPGRAGREDRQAVRHPGRQGVLHQLRHRGQRDRAAAGHLRAQERPGARHAAELPRPLASAPSASPATAAWKNNSLSPLNVHFLHGADRHLHPVHAGCPTPTTSRPASTTCATCSPPPSPTTWPR